MSPQEPVEQNQPSTPDRTAFKLAQQAFANGWIDLADLDRRLELIANAPDEETAHQAVADLDSVPNRVARRAEPAPDPAPKRPAATNRANDGWRLAGDVVFGAVLLAFVINLLVWGIIALTKGPQYFWPMWMLIPLTVVGGGWAMLRWSLRKDRD